MGLIAGLGREITTDRGAISVAIGGYDEDLVEDRKRLSKSRNMGNRQLNISFKNC